MYNEPLNIQNSVKFFLDFKDSIGKVEIGEPIGFDASNFKVEQEKGRYARDISFVDVDYTFSSDVSINGLTHRFSELIARFKSEGFEANISFILEIQGVDYVIGELDFATATTDLTTELICKVIQEPKQVIIKRKSDINNDLLGTSNISGEPVTAIETHKILLQATPDKQISEWHESEEKTGEMTFDIAYVLSFTPSIILSGIEDTLSPAYEFFSDATFVKDKLKFIKAKNNLTELTLNLSNFTYDFGATNTVQLRYKYGLTLGTATESYFVIPSTASNYSVEFDLPTLERDEYLWMWFKIQNTGTNDMTATSGTFNIASTSLSISSTIDGIRFIDAFRFVVNSISEMNVIAPYFDVGGEYYNQFITNGLLLRQIKEEPFNLSLDDLIGHLPEINADYQIINENTIFLGVYEDFHKDENIGTFTMHPNNVFRKSFNDLYSINSLNLKFSKWETEEDEDGSREGVHTEMQLSLNNNNVENTKQVNIGFIRDSFLIEKIRKDAVKVTEETATKDDNGVIILDVIEKELSFSENMVINQFSTGVLNQLLNLSNDNSFNWELLGIQIYDAIEITGSNAGFWVVSDISPNVLELAVITNPDPIVNVTEIIQFSYDVTSTNLTQRLGDGFVDLGELFHSNLKYSNKRIILNSWDRYLKTALQFNNDGVYVSKYIHNRLYQSQLQSQAIIVEGDKIEQSVLKDALVTPFLIETELITDFETFWQLSQDIRNKRGYIDVLDNEGNTSKIFPRDLNFDWARNLLTVIGEEKL